MNTKLHIDPALLARLAERGVSVKDTDALWPHLKSCSSCAGAYVQACLKSAPIKAVAPESIWSAIEPKIGSSQRSWHQDQGHFTPGFRLMVRAATVCIAIIVALFLGLLVFQRKAEKTTLDVGQYLAALEYSKKGPNSENLHEHFVASEPSTPNESKLDRNLPSMVGGYHLVEKRTLAPSANIVQLLYDSGQDSFALFVAPPTATLKLGSYKLVRADLDGLECQRIQCPRQDVYLLARSAKQYVFVRRHSSSGDSGQIFRELMQKAP